MRMWLVAIVSIATACRGSSHDAPTQAATTSTPTTPTTAPAVITTPARDHYDRALPPGAVARMGHDLVDDAAYLAIAFTPDGASVITGSASRVLVWDARTALPRAQLATCNHAAAIEVFPDGVRVLVGDLDSVRVIDLTTGELVWKIANPDGAPVGDAHVSPDSTVIAIARAKHDAPAELRDADTGAVVRTVGRAVTALAFSPDGKRLALVGNDAKTAKLTIVAVATGKTITTFDTHQPAANRIDWRGSTIAFGGDTGTLGLWSETGTALAQLAHDNAKVTSVALSPDGTRIATVQRRLRVRDTTTGAIVFEHDAGTQGTHTVAFSPDGKRLAWWEQAAGVRCDDLRIVDLANNAVTPPIERHDGAVGALAFSPDDSRLISGSVDASARIWRIADGSSLTRLGTEFSDGSAANLAAIAVARDGTIAVGSRSGTVTLYSADGATVLRTLAPAKDWIPDLAFSPDGSQLAVVAPSAANLQIYDAHSGALVSTLPINGLGDPKGVAFTPDGRLVVATVGDDIVSWELATGKRLRVLESSVTAVTGSIARIAIAPDGQQLAVPIATGLSVRRLDATRTRTIARGAVSAFAWSPDGRTIAVSTPAGTRLMSVADASARVLTTDEATAAAFSHAGDLLALGRRDGTIVVWRLR